MVMMIPKQSFDSFLVTLHLFFLVSFVIQTLGSSIVHHCRHDQRDALLEFKHEFPVNESYPATNNMSSWNERDDCCSWYGVTCEAKSGKVISLDLALVFLNNTLKPNSGLFKLQYLQHLSLYACHLKGEIPFSLGNLSHLNFLDLSFNKLVGQIPSSIGKITQLSLLNLATNKLSCNVPISFSNLTKLTTLFLDNNYFESKLPSDMSRLHNLEYISVSTNSFSGLIPESISKLPNLIGLDLSSNNFIGPIPGSISKLVNLFFLDVSNNKLEGKVPGCLWRLMALDLSQNSFSNLGNPSELVDQPQMLVLRLNSNMFRGPFPHWVCKFQSINFLDLSNNSLSGSIPQCVRNITTQLEVLNLKNNNFSGILPDVFANAINLNTLDVSHNQLEGKLPKSLLNCKDIRLLNVESNNFKDKFPSWFGSLPLLNVLILGSNKFYGALYHQNVSIGFQNLKVIDVSHNDFTGTFSAFYFSNWQGMTTLNIEYNVTYMEDYLGHHNSMEMMHKGVDTEFEVIRKDFIAIDFSGNKFSGKIPESIGLLKGLRHLNISSNAFTSSIPKSLANLTNLEALDLSQNQLMGQIPQDLGFLSFLSTMNFSHNNLEGPIPWGTQFQRQKCSSFMDNPKLYGLEDICGKTHAIDPQKSEELSEPEEQVINWIAAAIAYGPGVFCGLVIGHIFVSHEHEGLMEKFHRFKNKVVIRRGP